MAMSHSPFFFPTTAPAYAHTTVFPPPPFGFGAPAYGYSASPFPYPPPASAYMPTSDFSPNWPTWPPPVADPTPYAAPSTFPSTTTSSDSPFQHPMTLNRELRPPQSHTKDLFIDRLPSTSTATKNEAAALASSPINRLLPDCFNHDREVTSSSPSSMPQFFSSAATRIGFGSSASSTPTAKTPSGSTTTAVSSHSTLPNTGAAASSSATAHGDLQVFAEMPQHYGFHNLNRRSVFLADGTEHSFYALPENYPLERAMSGPVFDACADEMDGCSTEFVDVLAGLPEKQTYEQEAGLAPVLCSKMNNTTGSESMLVHNLQMPVIVQDTSNVFKEMPVYDVYEEDPTVDIIEAVTEEVDLKAQNGKPERPTDENKSDHELIVVCVNKASDNLFSDDATDYASIHVPYLGVGDTMKCSLGNNKMEPPLLPGYELSREHGKAQQVNSGQWSMLITESGRKEWDPGASVPFISSKIQHRGQALHPATHTPKHACSICIQSNVYVYWASEICITSCASACLTTTSDAQIFSLELHRQDGERPEINIKKQDMLINKHGNSDSKSNVSFFKSGTYPQQRPCNLSNDKEELLWDLGSVRSKTRCSISCLKFSIREAYPILPCTWDPGIHMFSYNRLHLFRWNPHPAMIILQQLHNKNFCSMSPWQFSLERGRKLQWDPGIELLLYDLLWSQTLSKGTECAMRHLLSGKFFTETAAIMCCPLPNLIQQRRNVATVLYSWRSIFHDMHYRQIFQKCKARSSQLYRHEYIKFSGIALWLITFNPP